MTYSYYFRYILTFFFLSSYSYTNCHLLCQLKNLKIFFFCLNKKRLYARKDLNFYFFLLLLSFPFSNFISTSYRVRRQTLFMLSLNLTKKKSYLFLERFIFFMYAFGSLDAYKNNHHANDQFIIKLKKFRFLEYYKFKEKKYYENLLLLFKQRCEIQFFFSPCLKNSLFEQRNLLRCLNIPFSRF